MNGSQCLASRSYRKNSFRSSLHLAMITSVSGDIQRPPCGGNRVLMLASQSSRLLFMAIQMALSHVSSLGQVVVHISITCAMLPSLLQWSELVLTLRRLAPLKLCFGVQFRSTTCSLLGSPCSWVDASVRVLPVSSYHIHSTNSPLMHGLCWAAHPPHNVRTPGLQSSLRPEQQSTHCCPRILFYLHDVLVEEETEALLVLPRRLHRHLAT